MLNDQERKPPALRPATDGVGLPHEVELYCRHRLNPELSIMDCYVKAGFTRRRTKAKQKEAEDFDNRPAVKKRIGELRHMVYHRMELTAQRIEEEYVALAFTKITDIVDWGVKKTAIGEDGDGNIVYHETPYVEPVPANQLSDGAVAAIQEISMGPNGIKIKMHDKFKALDAIARRHDSFKPRQAIELNEDDLPPEEPLTEEEIEAINSHFEDNY